MPGVRFVEWQGREWVATFGDPVAEHLAVRSACGMWDQSALRKWDVRGPDALAVVDRFFTNDMASLGIGQLRYGAFCDDAGRMLGDGTAFRYGPSHVRVAAARAADGDALFETAGSARVELEEVTDLAPHLQLQGPASRDVLGSLTGADLSQLGYYRFWPAPVEVAGVPVVVARCGYSGELGYELTCRPEDAPALWRRLLATGRVTPYGRDAVETLRQEAGLILVGSDYVPGGTDPYEMNLDRVVRLDAGWFRGRDALRERGGRPGRRLTSLLLAGGDVPCAGAQVLRSGEVVGEVRSACASPTLGRVLALAVVEVGTREPGTMLSVALPDAPPVRAAVGTFPAYDPERRRPRA